MQIQDTIKSSQTSLEGVSLCNLDSEEDPSHFQASNLVQNPVVILLGYTFAKGHRPEGCPV